VYAAVQLCRILSDVRFGRPIDHDARRRFPIRRSTIP